MPIKEDFNKIESYRWTCHSGKHGYSTSLDAEVCCDGNLRPFVKETLIKELESHIFWVKSHPKIQMCAECLHGDGHPFHFCPRCPGKAVELRNLGYAPTYRQYLEKSTSQIVFNTRADIFYSNLKYKNHQSCWDTDQPVRWWDEQWIPYTPEEKVALGTSGVNYEKYSKLGQEFLIQHLGFNK